MIPKVIGQGQFEIFKKYLPLLLGTPLTLKKNDLDKISKIEKYFKLTGKVTNKQFNAFKHYCRIYGVQIPNSLIFILED
jgi:hypothetical protein